LHTDVVTYLEVLAILLLTGFVSVAMGLLVSALASSQDQATSFIPLVLIPQLLFAGSIVAYQSMSAPVQALSTFVYSRWSFAGVGSAVGMNTRLAADPVARGKNRFGPDFFTLSTSTTCLILLAFMAVFFAAVALLVRRRAPR